MKNFGRKMSKLSSYKLIYFFMNSTEKEMKEKARKIEELFKEWQESLKLRDREKLSKISYEILKAGEEFMKKMWHKVIPGDRLSDFAKNVLKEEDEQKEAENT